MLHSQSILPLLLLLFWSLLLPFHLVAAIVFEAPVAASVVIATSAVAVVVGIVLSFVIYVQPSSSSMGCVPLCDL